MLRWGWQGRGGRDKEKELCREIVLNDPPRVRWGRSGEGQKWPLFNVL